jgi:hypothetical protein
MRVRWTEAPFESQKEKGEKKGFVLELDKKLLKLEDKGMRGI